MPMPMALLSDLADATQAGRGGDPAAGKAILSTCLADLDRLQVAMLPAEQMMVLAAAGNACTACAMWPEAIDLFERVCALAERLEPASPQTAGDYRSLGVCYAAAEQWDRAIAVFQHAREILIRAGTADAYVAEIDRQVVAVRERMRRSEPPPRQVTASALTGILDRLRQSRRGPSD